MVPLIVHSAHHTFNATQTNNAQNKKQRDSGQPDWHTQLVFPIKLMLQHSSYATIISLFFLINFKHIF